MVSKVDAEEKVSRILSETVLTVPQACKEIAEVTGKPLGRATLHRWMLRGSNGTRLESVKLSSRIILTSSEAIHRFFVSQNTK